jgi:hypothetical protein
MAALPSELRIKLERTITEARETAEAGTKAALEALAVHHHEPYPHMNPAQRELRVALRAHARQLGDQQNPKGELTMSHLVQECAYEHWHRMLFARFLAENGLLIEPDSGMAISLGEAEELAKSAKIDLWSYASRCAQRMLPQIFRPDDPLLQVTLANEHRVKLERLLAGLDPAAFKADDALGWVYQFWQSRKKDEINHSGVKIGADEIPAVTQLFTEPYMVEFLLHNTLGAWWAGKNLTAEDAESAEAEQELRQKVSLPGVTWDYLRFVREASASEEPRSEPSSATATVKSRWRPAAGTFAGWPKTAAELRVLDPCCGSGHFLVAALHHLVPIRMAEEGLSKAAAVDAVLRDNLHGLEIDERCCQIAAFALAFAAWAYPDAGGYRLLPELNIACTGIGPQCSAEQWLKLAEESGIPMPAIGGEFIKQGLLNLHELFSQASTLGSLINPANLPGHLIAADFETIQPYLKAILEAEKTDDGLRERAIAAAGMVKAAELLADDYTLVITNVPYLGRGKQDEILKKYLEVHYKEGKADLATAFALRCLDFCQSGADRAESKESASEGDSAEGRSGGAICHGSVALVTPQNWLFLTTYTKLRERLLKERQWNFVARLGPGAFETIGGHVVNVSLLALTARAPDQHHLMAGVDASAAKGCDEKAALLRGERAEAASTVTAVSQAAQLENPDARIALGDAARSPMVLRAYADGLHGQGTFDKECFTLKFWECGGLGAAWVPQQSTPQSGSKDDYGATQAFRWEGGAGLLFSLMEAKRALGYTSGKWRAGVQVWGQEGVAVSGMGRILVRPYLGKAFDENVAVVKPFTAGHLLPIITFCESGVFERNLRTIDRNLKASCRTLVKVSFDLAYWQKIAAEKYPNGLPEPESDDPTQWLFHGFPGGKVDAACSQLSDEQKRQDAATALQVAVARVLGYHWPAELDDKMRLSQRARALVARCRELAKFADNDGIVCIPAVRGEDPAADRLLQLLAACEIKPGVNLDDWLRNSFFEEHCKLFHHRSFIWHIWDGRKHDGFHALVNYHKLADAKQGRMLLEKLTYTYLGDWISRQESGVKRGDDGAEDRLAAAEGLQKRLAAILEGEPPFDIFVRWKPLARQPIGWEPDINDGVRANIRPFLAVDLSNGKKGAGVLRWKPNIKWDKDRGKEPQRKKEEFPWFWGWDGSTDNFMGGKEFDGNRWNNCHYSNNLKQTAREAGKESR